MQMCCDAGRFSEVIRSFQSMQLDGDQIDKGTFLAVLNACTKAEALVEGRRVHSYAVESGWSEDIVVGTATVNMFGKCGSVDEALAIFAELSQKNVVSWSVMVAAYARKNDYVMALSFLRKMQLEGVLPNKFTFVNALGSCCCSEAISEGRIVHRWIAESGLLDQSNLNLVVTNALISMYRRCGCVEEALNVFSRAQNRDVVMWTSMIAAYNQSGRCDAAFQLFMEMQLDGSRPDKITFVTILNSKLRSSSLARMIHELIIECGLDSDSIIGTALIEMHSDCGEIAAASLAFERISQKHVVPWSALISTKVDHGECKEAFVVFRKMQLEGIQVDEVALITILGACGSSSFIVEGKMLHSFVTERGFQQNIVVANALIEMYGRCRDLRGADETFIEILPHEDVVSWNSTIAAFGECGKHDEAILRFRRMQLQVEEAEEMGRLVFETGACDDDPEDQAHELFARMDRQSAVCWNLMIGSCCKCEDSLGIFRRMQLEGRRPDRMTLVGVLNACARGGKLLADGKLILHGFLEFFYDDELITAAVIRMFGKCGSLEDAQRIFDRLQENHGVVTWNSLATAYGENGKAKHASHLIQKMLQEGFQADKVTLCSALNSCEDRSDLEFGQRIHQQVVRSGWESDTVLGTAVINMYGNCGCLEAVYGVFNGISTKDLVSVNALITALVQQEERDEALVIFRKIQLEGFGASKATFITVLNACVRVSEGMLVHGCIEEGAAAHADVFADAAVGNALVTMYGRCGEVEAALEVLYGMQVKDVVTWNIHMALFNNNDNQRQVIHVFYQMQLEGIRPDKISLVTVINALGELGDSLRGREFELLAIEVGVYSDEVVKNGLINLYAKSGHVDRADELFEEISRRDVVSWNSMIAGYGQTGDLQKVLGLFLEMQLHGVDPDDVTFISVLASCSHSGEITSGLKIFASMSTDFGVAACLEHYGCMVDLYGRSGRLEEAEKVVMEGRFQAFDQALHWMIMLGACRVQNDTRRGEFAAMKLMEVQPENESTHVVLSNIYADTVKKI